MKDPTPEQAVRAAVTTVMLHGLITRTCDGTQSDDTLIERALSLADKLIAKVFP